MEKEEKVKVTLLFDNKEIASEIVYNFKDAIDESIKRFNKKIEIVISQPLNLKQNEKKS